MLGFKVKVGISSGVCVSVPFLLQGESYVRFIIKVKVCISFRGCLCVFSFPRVRVGVRFSIRVKARIRAMMQARVTAKVIVRVTLEVQFRV